MISEEKIKIVYFSINIFIVTFLLFILLQVFVHAKVFFSLGGQKFTREPVQFSYMPDQVLDHARDVTIKLHNRIGRYVRLHLYFAARWMMLSEITFISGKQRGEYFNNISSQLGIFLCFIIGLEAKNSLFSICA